MAETDAAAFKPRPQTEAAEKLRALGYEVEALPDGLYRVTAAGWSVTSSNPWQTLRRLTMGAD